MPIAITLDHFVLTTIPAIVAAVVTAVLTVRLSFRRFQAERWWDRKADAYANIIGALQHCIIYNSTVVRGQGRKIRFTETHKEEIFQKRWRVVFIIRLLKLFEYGLNLLTHWRSNRSWSWPKAGRSEQLDCIS